MDGNYMEVGKMEWYGTVTSMTIMVILFLGGWKEKGVIIIYTRAQWT